MNEPPASVEHEPPEQIDPAFAQLYDRITELEAELAQHQWHSVDFENDAPPVHTHIWCLNRDGKQFEGCICYGMHRPFFTYPRGDGNASNTCPDWIDVVGWMPLPDSTPPEQEVSE